MYENAGPISMLSAFLAQSERNPHRQPQESENGDDPDREVASTLGCDLSRLIYDQSEDLSVVVEYLFQHRVTGIRSR
ncbi:hypothetical protein CDEST_02509 [Colletotrichum destructivum]|uniref:Uncharacterized protein n=1 Tax=Colletotrichum destructivum TaxID=34406 RepID=A0AAX4I2M4_9PEZI|nr:hypothetical protein CDEST_02509 [Colletotrichum destructivum]